VPGHWGPANCCQAASGNPGLASAVDRNWTQESMAQNLDQDCKQDKEQGPPQKLAMNKESKTFMIPQLHTEDDVFGMEYLAGQYVFCPPLPAIMSLYNSSFAETKRSISDLVCFLIINMGLFCVPFLPLSQYNYKH